MTSLTEIQESAVTLVAESARIEGKISFDQITRVHGVLIGEVESKDGSTLILGETGLIEGTVKADILVVDGYIRGDIYAKTRVLVSRTGRVVGNILTPSLKVEFGAYFEGRCGNEDAPLITSKPSLKPA